MRCQTLLTGFAFVACLSLMSCASNDPKPDTDKNKKLTQSNEVKPAKPAVDTIPLAESRRQVNAVFKRGVNHGLGIGVTTLLVKTRNFESVWDAFLQNIRKFPTLIPYVLGFLDSVRSDDPPLKPSEERRTARKIAISLFRGSIVSTDAFKERCYLVVLKIVELAQNSELEEQLLPIGLREELKREIKREVQLNIKGERLNYATRILELVRTPENLERDLKLFKSSVENKRWDLAEATLPNVDSSPDARVLEAFRKAFQEILLSGDNANLAAKLLRSIAKRSVDNQLLSFASAAVANKRPVVLQMAGTFALGRFYGSEDSVQKVALQKLFVVLNGARDTGLQLGALLQIQRFKAEAIVSPLTTAEVQLKARPAGTAKEVLNAVSTALVNAKQAK